LISALRRVEPVPTHPSLELLMSEFQHLKWLSILANALLEYLLCKREIVVFLRHVGPSDIEQSRMSTDFLLMKVLEDLSRVFRLVSVLGADSNEAVIICILPHFHESSSTTLHQQELLMSVRWKYILIEFNIG
jgi:hypothetical protein